MACYVDALVSIWILLSHYTLLQDWFSRGKCVRIVRTLYITHPLTYNIVQRDVFRIRFALFMRQYELTNILIYSAVTCDSLSTQLLGKIQEQSTCNYVNEYFYTKRKGVSTIQYTRHTKEALNKRKYCCRLLLVLSSHFPQNNK